MNQFYISALSLLLLFGAATCSQNSGGLNSPVTQAPIHNPNILNAVVNDSLLVMTAVKDGNIPVKGSFYVNAGQVQKTSFGDWQLQLSFDPKTWNSGLAQRDQRVRDIFFQVAKTGFDSIRFEASGIADDVVQKVKAGTDQTVAVKGTLFFAGLQKNVNFNAALKLDNGLIVVANVEPIVISIADWGLDAAKKTLMLECGHREIQDAINVTFAVKFE